MCVRVSMYGVHTYFHARIQNEKNRYENDYIKSGKFSNTLLLSNIKP